PMGPHPVKPPRTEKSQFRQRQKRVSPSTVSPSAQNGSANNSRNYGATAPFTLWLAESSHPPATTKSFFLSPRQGRNISASMRTSSKGRCSCGKEKPAMQTTKELRQPDRLAMRFTFSTASSITLRFATSDVSVLGKHACTATDQASSCLNSSKSRPEQWLGPEKMSAISKMKLARNFA